jgi:hypothetical protein
MDPSLGFLLYAFDTRELAQVKALVERALVRIVTSS